MKFSKQVLMGTGVFLGGIVLLYATVHQVVGTGTTANNTTAPAAAASVAAHQPIKPDSKISNSPLTADIQTEKNILAAKQREREARVQQQEQAAQQYLTEQQRIEAEAIAKSRAETQLYTNSQATATTSTVVTQPVVKPRPIEANQSSTTQPLEKPVEATPQPKPASERPQASQIPKPTVEAPSKPTSQANATITNANKASATQTTAPIKTPPTIRPDSYQVKSGEGLIGLSRRYNVPVEILAEANNLNKNSALRVGQALTIPSAAYVQRIQQQAAQKEQQRQQEIARKKQEAIEKEQERAQYQAAQQKLKEARQTVKETEAKGSFGVQVALAADETKAQEIVKKLQAAGYKVKTSQTSRGVRVVVGPETGKTAALALKDKVNSDPRIDASNAWVLYW